MLVNTSIVIPSGRNYSRIDFFAARYEPLLVLVFEVARVSASVHDCVDLDIVVFPPLSIHHSIHSICRCRRRRLLPRARSSVRPSSISALLVASRTDGRTDGRTEGRQPSMKCCLWATRPRRRPRWRPWWPWWSGRGRGNKE